MNFKVLSRQSLAISETPVWDSRISKLYYTGLFDGTIHCLDIKTSNEEIYQTHQPIGGICLCDDPDYILCALEAGMFLLNLKTKMLDFIVNPEKRTGFKFNDTRVDPAGRIFTSSVSKYFGSDKYSPNMLGCFYMIDTDNSVSEITGDITQYNGIAWNKACSKLYVVDTENMLLLEADYSFEKGILNPPKTAIDLKAIGMPDGLCMDADDNIYICHWTGKISVFDKDLNLKNIISCPEEQICCCSFGLESLDTLFIATANYGYDKEKLKNFPNAGRIFSIEMDIKGKPENYYHIK